MKATEGVGRALDAATVASGARGVDLWSTMRRGSDYWRPGALLSEAAEHRDVEFFRHEDLCPPPALLDRFRVADEPIPFGEFAQCYADWLIEDHRIGRAVRAVVEGEVLRAGPISGGPRGRRGH